MLGGSRCAEKVCLRSSRKHQKIALILLSFSSFDSVRLEIDGDYLPELHVNVRVSSEDTSQAKSHVGCRQRSRSDLVEQRLKLLIIVLVD